MNKIFLPFQMKGKKNHPSSREIMFGIRNFQKILINFSLLGFFRAESKIVLYLEALKKNISSQLKLAEIPPGGINPVRKLV